MRKALLSSRYTIRWGGSAVGVFLLWCLWRIGKRRLRLRLVGADRVASGPGLFGSLRVLFRFGDLPDFYADLLMRFGPTVSLVLGSRSLAVGPSILLVSKPADLKHVLKTRFENYPKGAKLQAIMMPIFGRGIFGTDGAQWLAQRKTASRMFSSHYMRTVVQASLDSKIGQLLDRLRASECSSVDLQEMFFEFTMDLFTEIGFGVHVDVIQGAEFAESFDALQTLCPRRYFLPQWPLQRRLLRAAGSESWVARALCGDERDIARCEATVAEGVKRLAAAVGGELHEGGLGRARAEAAATGGHRPSGVGSLEPGVGTPPRLRNLAELLAELDASPDVYREMLMSLLVGGRDTTALALTWAAFNLCKHPAVLDRLEKELRQAGEPPSAMKHKTSLLEAVVKETIRLYPPVPLDAKVAAEDDALPDGTFVGKGSVVLFSPYASARDCRLWGPDAREWNPDRWLRDPLESMDSMDSPYLYSAFNAGPRTCLGRDLALHEAKSVISALVLSGWTFRLEREDEVPAYVMGVGLRMKGGLRVHVGTVAGAKADAKRREGGAKA